MTAMPAPKILIAEDDPLSSELLVSYLEADGFEPVAVADGNAAMRLARRGDFDLAIFDLGLPGVDGLNLVRTLRREGKTFPILIVTGRADEVDKVVTFEAGVDDYVTKPFLPREVVYRVRAILRRSGGEVGEAGKRLVFGPLEVDEAAREVRVDGADLGLRPKEYALFHALASNAGVALSREQIIAKVWSDDYDGDDRTIDGHVRRIRAKLEAHRHVPIRIATIYGFGYKLVHGT